MKKVVLLLTFAFVPLVSFCQSLSLDELINLYTFQKEKAGEYLVAKGWNAREVVTMKSATDFVVMPWEKGSSLLSLAEFKGQRRRVTYQAESAEMEAIQAKAQAWNMTRIRAGLDPEGTKYAIYVGANYGVKIVTRLDGTHLITVIDKKDLRWI